ncbi:MAG TPA: type 1 glutamine amidotransferase domain-containing protein [Candidatus Acidoferrum sp.]|nr:type 1 glutamine amidotransferase domain-containing protein [Candidatus Acidoferrum sp.]
MRIACLLESDFEDSEFKQPYEAFKQAGHQVTVIGQEAGRELKGKKGQVSTKAEAGVDQVRPEQFDALFIPGGYSPDRLRANPKMVEFTRAFVDAQKPVLAICHGPQLLITAGAVKGRTLTAWKTIQEDLKQVGANVVDQEVVVDKNLVTSRQPSDIPAFNRESLKLLEKVPVGAR